MGGGGGGIFVGLTYDAGPGAAYLAHEAYGVRRGENIELRQVLGGNLAQEKRLLHRAFQLSRLRPVARLALQSPGRTRITNDSNRKRMISLRGRAIAASARPSACIIQRRRVSGGGRRLHRRGTAMLVGGREQRGRVQRWRGRRRFCPELFFRQSLCSLFQSRSNTIAARLERQRLHPHGQRRRSMRATIAHRIIFRACAWL
jgi:hypothetical protein